MFEHSPYQATIYINRSLSLIEKKDFHGALADIEKGLGLFPDQYALYTHRGIIFAELGQEQLGIQDVSLAINQLPDGVVKSSSYYARGRIYAKNNEHEKAIQDFNHSITLMPDNPRKSSFYRARGNAYSSIGNHQLAIDDYSSAISLEPNNKYTYASRGHSFMVQNKYDEALKDLNTAILLDPSFAIAYLGRAEIHLQLGSFSNVIREIDLVLPFVHDPETKSLALVRRGIAFGNIGELNEALSDLDQSITLTPNYTYAYLQRAKIHEKDSKYRLVISDCTKALEYDLEFEIRIELLNLRGSAFDDLGMFDSALEDFRQAIIIDNRNAVAYMNIGITLMKQGNHKVAIDWFNKALSRNPQLWEVYSNRGSAFNEMGKIERGIKDFNKALDNQYLRQLA